MVTASVRVHDIVIDGKCNMCECMHNCDRRSHHVLCYANSRLMTMVTRVSACNAAIGDRNMCECMVKRGGMSYIQHETYIYSLRSDIANQFIYAHHCSICCSSSTFELHSFNAGIYIEGASDGAAARAEVAVADQARRHSQG